MKSRVIKRHDNAVRTLVFAIQKGTKGNFALIADVNTSDDPTGTEDTLLLPPRDDTQIPKRLPNHLLTLLRGALNRLRPPAGHTPLSSDPDNSVHDMYRLLYTQYQHQVESYATLSPASTAAPSIFVQTLPCLKEAIVALLHNGTTQHGTPT